MGFMGRMVAMLADFGGYGPDTRDSCCKDSRFENAPD